MFHILLSCDDSLKDPWNGCNKGLKDYTTELSLPFREVAELT